MSRKVLLVDDDAAVREALAQTLELADLQVTEAGSFVAAKDHITPGFDGVILSDIRMPGRDGFHLLAYARGQDPDLPVILLTGEGDIPMAVTGDGAGRVRLSGKTLRARGSAGSAGAGVENPRPWCWTTAACARSGGNGRSGGADDLWHVSTGRRAARPGAARGAAPRPRCWSPVRRAPVSPRWRK